ncbi:hypothetical protein ['Paenibacillus yunnanensis' Narsing Rao et al. 2020]|uniref:hypothetical protein n=1 Tax=Paenibacillus tengchongensis TaxID=2608684 RepID=UPI001651FE59|nr:hypothetical protein [Paenibacillus tengchongensis]
MLQKLSAAGQEFVYPVRVLTTTEAAALVQGLARDRAEQWAVPAHWHNNEDGSAFRQWKAGLLERAEQTRQEREKREDELSLWQKTGQHFRQFLDKFPLAASQALEQQLQASRERLIGYTEEHKRSEQRQKQLEAAADKIRSELSEMQDLIHQLGDWLKDGQRYLTLNVEREELEKALAPVKEQVASLEKQLRMKQYHLARVQEEYQTALQEQSDANMKLQLLRKDELYENVQSFAYADTDRSLAELKAEHRVLEQERAGLLKERSQLESEQRHERDKASLADKAMTELRREYPELDEEMSLPAQPEAKKQDLWRQIEEYRKGRERAAEQLHKVQSKLQKSEGRIAILQQQFAERFPEQEYAAVNEFRQTMEVRIQRIIHLMEETIQTHDRDLQEFIQRIHTHLKHIVQELKELPKKTRVKTADGWREIYSFSIPEWEDQDGKDRIRSHIEWIITQLDRYQVTDEQGKSQQGDIRKSLEKWLDSRRLLQVVLKGEAMKVTCRKVMNDHQVTKASYSWEQSNRWSGGEKWSKNMTLFLGLLNYVAERRQYIKDTMKLHRTVILDNPFGKASSDHVLSPVFFIAEQLGFQIIALTAHAEGKFLQDYFPIVYSCRLRSTSDASKQIIEPTQQIQHAYFRDKAPETLERMDSRVDQLELF